MEINYITDNILIQDNKMLYHTKNTMKPIQHHNWHKVLNECGWAKLSSKWISKLNKQLKNPTKNSLFGCLDCGDDGDCLFHCISHALNNINDERFKNYDSKDIRKIITEHITEEQYLQIIEYYRILKDSQEFDETWDPYSIHSKDDLCSEIMKGGSNYWGDFLLLQLLQSILHVNILILTNDSHNNIYEPYPTMNEYNSSYNTIILLYEDNIHFKLVGYFKENNMIYLFTHETIPFEIVKIYSIYR